MGSQILSVWPLLCFPWRTPDMTTLHKLDKIPVYLRERPQWVCWKYEHRVDKGIATKRTKVPYRADVSGLKASPTDSTTWTSFDVALAALKPQGQYDGIGYVICAKEQLSCVDLDHVIHKGVLDSNAFEIV